MEADLQHMRKWADPDGGHSIGAVDTLEHFNTWNDLYKTKDKEATKRLNVAKAAKKAFDQYISGSESTKGANNKSNNKTLKRIYTYTQIHTNA